MNVNPLNGDRSENPPIAVETPGDLHRMYVRLGDISTKFMRIAFLHPFDSDMRVAAGSSIAGAAFKNGHGGFC